MRARLLDRSHRFSLALLALAAGSGSCLCQKEMGDEERLRRKVDVLPVHLYVGTKATLAESDEKAAATRALLLKALSARAGGSEPEVSLGDLLRAGSTVLELRSRGARIVRGEKETRALIPALTRALGGGLAATWDVNTDHALLMGAMIAIKVHPKTPVPIPDELILYEASRTDADALPRLRGLAHLARALVFGRSELCDLAAAEARAFIDAPSREQEIAGLVALLPRARPLDGETRRKLGGALEALAHAGSALCFLKRGEEQKAREPLGRMIDALEKAGVRDPVVDLLRVYLECAKGKAEAAAAIARLEGLASDARAGALKKELALLEEYCKTSAGTSSRVLERIAFVDLVLKLTLEQVGRIDITEGSEEQAAFRAVHGLARVTTFLSRAGQSIPSGGAVKERARGLLERVRGAGATDGGR